MKHSLLPTLILVFGLALATTHAAGKLGDWKHLGQKEANLKVDRDEIAVGVGEGFFKAIKLEVRKAGVEFISLRVVYATGADQQIEVRKMVRAGGETRIMDLDGRNRNLRKVVFIYRTDPKARKRAIVVLYGRR